jgi:thiosulfate/3-mercaptopyruvate sulfurtransferase
MKTNRILSLVIGLVLALTYGLTAQIDIISTEAFKDLMKANPELVIVDAGKSKSYAASHLKGAIHINHLDLYQKENEIDGLILSPEDLAAFFGNKGISEKSEVVIYDDGSQKYNTRIYWVLKYIGAENVKMLHRDMDEWGKFRLPLTSAATELKAVTFTPTVNPDLIADMDLVKKATDDKAFFLLDARAPEEYDGSDGKSLGHIPGAINVDYVNFLDEKGAFKSEEELRTMVAELGITPDMEVIAYCKTSVRAAPAYVALKNILGFEKVKVYDGAYNEWAASNPLVQ